MNLFLYRFTYFRDYFRYLFHLTLLFSRRGWYFPWFSLLGRARISSLSASYASPLRVLFSLFLYFTWESYAVYQFGHASHSHNAFISSRRFIFQDFVRLAHFNIAFPLIFLASTYQDCHYSHYNYPLTLAMPFSCYSMLLYISLSIVIVLTSRDSFIFAVYFIYYFRAFHSRLAGAACFDMSVSISRYCAPLIWYYCFYDISSIWYISCVRRRA